MSASAEGTAPRCPVCGARAWRAQADGALCTWCGAYVAGSWLGAPASVDALLTPEGLAAQGIHTDDYTYRIFASRFHHWFVPDGARFIEGHRSSPARGRSVPLAPSGGRVPVSLVILAPPRCDAAAARIDAYRTHFAEIVLVIDAPERAALRDGPVVRVCRPLAGNFGAQRNAGTARATTPWVLHLDTDEWIDDAVLGRLGAICACATDGGIAALGLPRLNLVDDRPSDLFPDVQYRLLRADQRFSGNVHERPDACADWPRTTIYQGGRILHALSADRVRRRQARYDALRQSAERHKEADALLTAFRP